MPVWLVVGLGNPGPEYASSRHNVGFRVLQAVAERAGVAWRRRFDSRWTAATLAGAKATLVLPQLFMNRSGDPVRAWVEHLRLPPACLLVIHDDIDLPLGRLKLIREGGHAGHKGVCAIQEALGTLAFPRLRLGVGRPPGKAETPEYVLGAFASAEEVAVAEGMIARAVEALPVILEEGIEAAMNRINVRPPAPGRGDGGGRGSGGEGSGCAVTS